MLRNPVELLEKLLEANSPVSNHLGLTAQDDFEHFCAYSGLREQTAGPGGEPGQNTRISRTGHARVNPITA